MPGVAFGLDTGVSTSFNCSSGTDIYIFHFEGLVPFSLNFIIEDITSGSNSSYPISGIYDTQEEKYTTDFQVTVNNGHLIKLYYEYSESGFYCKRLITQIGISECSNTDEDEDGFASDIDCNDSNANDFPFGSEFCDGYDNNCNGLVDDADPDIWDQPTWALDEDNDGFHLEGTEIKTCFQPYPNYIQLPYLNVTPDCDDSDPTYNPLTVWYRDLDGDGYANGSQISCSSPGNGYTKDILPISDCDDSDPNINPSITVECSDNKDNDCDGQVDEIEDLVIYLADNDNDGYGDANNIISCNPPAGYITIYANNPNNKFDCNDNNPLINPGITELPYNGIDDDCNSATADNSDSFSIPDPNFEQALIDLGIDTDGMQNNLVLVADLEAVTHLNLSFPETNPNLPNVNGKIINLSGIQLFINLVELNISGNNISDVRGLTGSNIGNKSTNKKGQLITNQNTIEVLNCSFNNLTSLDVSNMSALKSLNCSNNQLENLNVKNGINAEFILFNATNNANLNCIDVDNALYSINNWINIDAHTSFSEDCSSTTLAINAYNSLNEKIEVYPNPVIKTLNIRVDGSIIIRKITLYNILGQTITPKIITNKIDVNNCHSGLYFLKIETDQGNITKNILIK
jgi:hypothetical protein